MAGIISIVLERDGHDQPWGFRLQGGVDVAMPLSVQRVLVGTPSEGVLLKGDIITKISCTETKNITHQQAADLFNNAGNQIAVQIKRAGVQPTPAAASTAAPLVNGSPVQPPVSVPVSGGVPLPGITSNTTARPEVTGTLQQIQQTQQSLTTATQASNPTLVTKQYNSPLPLYSQENVQEAMRMQTSPSHTPTINPVASSAAADAAKALRKVSSPTPANKPVQVILTPSKEYNPQSSATWRALQETDAPIDPEKVANYSALKEHDPIYSEVYTAPVAPKPGQRPPARTNALPGPRSPVSELLPPPMRPANEVMADSETRSFLSPPKTGPSAVLSAALAESKPVDQMTTDRVKIPIYEDDYALLQETYNPPRRPGGPKTNAIGGRKKIAQTAFFNKLMMDVLGE
ncbi:PDZ and LIM domain protein 3-like isoform X8 [Homarus americanus]|uniref:PDZ and LIM domain protein 3-like isoform X8 n=1 Tax=Homarus americanus TaxID=6706 RepID=UPI001C46C27B|nr:PDZ and LIM domain protein 3-like isoform X8 [Homarus americanus]